MSEYLKYIPEDLKHSVEVKDKKLDDKYFERFNKCFFGESYEYLGGIKDSDNEVKNNLEKGNNIVELDYKNINDLDYDGIELELIKFKKDLRTRGSENRFISKKMANNEKMSKEILVKNAYRWKINEALAELRMLKCTNDGYKLRKENADPVEISNLDRKFDRYSKFIYGEPDKKMFDYFRINVIDGCNKCIDEKYPGEIKKAAISLKKELSIGLSENDKNKIIDGVPRIEVNSKISEKDTIKPDVFAGIMKEALKQIEADSEWQVVIDNDRTGMSINQAKKMVVVPGIDRKMSVEEVKALVMHEIGTHTQRRINGKRSIMKLISKGLDRYIKGEEGVATYNQQKITGFKNFSGEDSYLAIGLVDGIDSLDKDKLNYRNFADLYKILTNYYTVKLYKEGDNIEETIKTASKKAFNRCRRTFRGLNDVNSRKGYSYRKDLAYGNNMEIYRLVSNDNKAEESFLFGKFDPTNARHNYILSVLGITDSELEELKNQE